MKDNIRKAILVPECSMVVEAAHASRRRIRGVGDAWYRSFLCGIREGYSIYRLIDCTRNDTHPPIQGSTFWDNFRRRGR